MSVWGRKSHLRPYHHELASLLTRAQNLSSFGTLVNNNCAQELRNTALTVPALRCLGYFDIAMSQTVHVPPQWNTPVLTDVLFDGAFVFEKD